MNLIIKKASSPEDMNSCFAIRKVVFVEGQNVPLNEELDGKDKESEHYLLVFNEIPVGVTRVRYIDDYAKIERVAILDAYQGKGLGQALMQRIIQDIKLNNSIKIAKLSSQTHAIPFYEKLGFVVCSEVYLDADIPHKDMKYYLQKD